ncbi:hypothetical protein [Streptomyces sp. 35G-GA-8]|uniref:hypothetical protein n=1 Tax=Streptomyces sp. 35G-GA-8 TaxID=2939434 RepID=UPI00201E9049|nr:hypothetical protein [Streptomyces sp. 35G-GA-8]MCL7381259.1 hypothetical protein [Streptomyces sp. 35G-GA-8]
MADRHVPFVPRVVALLRRCVPPPALTGFLVLLMVLFGVSYAVGSAVGPVAPGMHSTDTGPQDSSDSPRGGDADDMGDMGGMHSDGGR